MSSSRTNEVFAAGCPAWDPPPAFPAMVQMVQIVHCIVGPGSKIRVLEAHDAAVAARATSLGILSAPRGVIDEALPSCCIGPGVDEAARGTELP